MSKQLYEEMAENNHYRHAELPFIKMMEVEYEYVEFKKETDKKQ